MLNPDTKLHIESYTNSKKPKIVNITSSPQTNERIPSQASFLGLGENQTRFLRYLIFYELPRLRLN